MAEILDGLSISHKIKQEIKEEVTKIVQSGKKRLTWQLYWWEKMVPVKPM